MFGEDAPRAGSPWDTLPLSPSPSPASSGLELSLKAGEDVPKLVPEIEEGNVEYKLKLIDPTPERFTRLVTQLKWRLLEGAGQAYYELGVADSGQLVGLTRKDMDASLETLEQMAGEIGASVAVVKEIEVPSSLIPLGTGKGGFARAIDGAMRARRKRGSGPPVEVRYTEDDTTPGEDTSAITEEETSGTTDFERGIPLRIPSHTVQAHSSMPFLNHKGPQHEVDWDEDPAFAFDLDLDVLAASAPPVRPLPLAPSPHRRAVKQFTPKPKTVAPVLPILTPAEKAAERRAKRDKRREDKRKALLVLAGFAESPSLPIPVPVSPKPMVIPEPPTIIPVVATSLEPRVIVEALVFRKYAVEEPFLDFDGLSLE